MFQEDKIEDGDGEDRASQDSQYVTDRLLSGLGAEHVPRLDVLEQIGRMAGDFSADGRRRQVRRLIAWSQSTEGELSELPHGSNGCERRLARGIYGNQGEG